MFLLFDIPGMLLLPYVTQCQPPTSDYMLAYLFSLLSFLACLVTPWWIAVTVCALMSLVCPHFLVVLGSCTSWGDDDQDLCLYCWMYTVTIYCEYLLYILIHLEYLPKSPEEAQWRETCRAWTSYISLHQACLDTGSQLAYLPWTRMESFWCSYLSY